MHSLGATSVPLNTPAICIIMYKKKCPEILSVIMSDWTTAGPFTAGSMVCMHMTVGSRPAVQNEDQPPHVTAHSS
jgi:hypothetical protein